MNEPRVFRISKKYCIFMTVAVFLGMALSSILTGQGIPLLGAVGVAAGLAVGLGFQKLKVSPEMVAMGRKKFPFTEGSVTFEKLSPLASWLFLGKGNGSAIIFRPSNGRKEQKIYFPLTEQDQAELVTLLAQYNTKA